MKAELVRAVFQNTGLTGVDFSYANLSRANLNGAQLKGVNLTQSYLYLTQLSGADLSGALGLTQAQIDIACGTTETKLPTGLVQPSSWPCAEEGN